MSTRTLIVFGREPRPGRVKTRLIPAIGGTAATEVYRRLLDLSLHAGKHCRCDRRQLWLDGPVGPLSRQGAQDNGFTLHSQPDGDLGTRMAGALVDALADGDEALLIGSDSPAYTPEYLDEAFDALQRHDAVVGPAHDGGYVLIGMKHPMPMLFENIPWSTPTVFEATCARLEAGAYRWTALRTLHDIDEMADLRRFPTLMDNHVDAYGQDRR